jgi:hypothetical protein
MKIPEVAKRMREIAELIQAIIPLNRVNSLNLLTSLSVGFPVPALRPAVLK